MNSIDQQKYFLGIIVGTDAYHKNPKKHRYLEDIDMDPFLDMESIDISSYGTPTILYKENDLYHDVLYGRYKNDLSYVYNKYNRLGIKLLDVAPFFDWYTDWFFPPFAQIISSQSTAENIVDLQDAFPYCTFYNPQEDIIYFDLLDDDPLLTYFDNYISKNFYIDEDETENKQLLLYLPIKPLKP